MLLKFKYVWLLKTWICPASKNAHTALPLIKTVNPHQFGYLVYLTVVITVKNAKSAKNKRLFLLQLKSINSDEINTQIFFGRNSPLTSTFVCLAVKPVFDYFIQRCVAEAFLMMTWILVFWNHGAEFRPGCNSMQFRIWPSSAYKSQN